MTSGKSLIGKKLAQVLDYEFIDLDDYIVKKEELNIAEIFNKKGEIYFRKIEHIALKDIISDNQNCVLSLGGGTPCYGNNLKLLLNDLDLKTFYLKASIDTISERLFNERKKRPLVSHIKTKEELLEFVGKHLFERLPYYSQAEFAVDANTSEQDLIESILMQLL
ncbi:UNVERIFIED_CONTAM: hypothetical protein GTU68_056804 [Idotea baltica]|nr:hypothetical protein [Idotea baltica]